MRPAILIALLLSAGAANAQSTDAAPAAAPAPPPPPRPPPPLPPPPPAAPVPPPPRPALPDAHHEGELSRSQWLIPTLQLSASTDDKGKLKTSVGRILGEHAGHVFAIWPRLEATSSQGVSRVFTSDDKGSLPVRYGAVFTVEHAEYWDRNVKIEDNEKIRVYDECVAVKAPGFDPKATVRTKRDFNSEALCPTGRQSWLEYESDLPIRESLPVTRFSLGAVLGRDQFKFLSGDPGPSAVRSAVTDKQWSWKFGASGVYTLPAGHNEGYLFEARAGYSRDWTPSDQTVHTCVPDGMLAGGGTVELCKDQVLGAPTEKRTTTLGFDLGVGDAFKQQWRVSVGVYGELTGPSDTIGIELPVYLNFASGPAPDGYSSDYKGLLRITPRIQRVRGSVAPSTTFILSVEILGQHSFFPEAID